MKYIGRAEETQNAIVELNSEEERTIRLLIDKFGESKNEFEFGMAALNTDFSSWTMAIYSFLALRENILDVKAYMDAALEIVNDP